MIEYKDECVSCPPELGCLGNQCPNKKVPYLICDNCKSDDIDVLYKYDDEELCIDCLLKNFEQTTVSDLE